MGSVRDPGTARWESVWLGGGRRLLPKGRPAMRWLLALSIAVWAMAALPALPALADPEGPPEHVVKATFSLWLKALEMADAQSQPGADHFAATRPWRRCSSR